MLLVERFFEDCLIKLGKFRCPATHPSFANTGPARGYLIVFPREPVEITQAGRSPVIANSNVLMFYNDLQEYRRRQISDWGDRCEFFDIDHDLLIESIRRHHPHVEEDAEQPFSFSNRVISNRVFMNQRQLVDQIQKLNNVDDRLAWEESAIQLINMVIDEAFADAEHHQPVYAAKPSHRDLVYDAQFFLSRNFHHNLTLAEIADAIDSSVFHLSRVFANITGGSLHQYLTCLRMRAALETIREGIDLTTIALDLGYSSHSHFTSVFKRSFGVTPKAWRASA